MSTTISVVCYKSKVLKNNESPLMLRICKDGKRKYESIGISILPSLWDFKQNKPTRKCPNKEYIERLIAEKVKVYRDKVIEFKSQEKGFTATSLMEKVNKPVKRKTVQEVFNQYIQELESANRLRYAGRSVGRIVLSMATVSTNGASGARSVRRVKSVRPPAVSATVVPESFSVALTPISALPGATRSRLRAA